MWSQYLSKRLGHHCQAHRLYRDKIYIIKDVILKLVENDKHKTQKIKAKNECEIENENKDHSKDDVNINGRETSNTTQAIQYLQRYW